MRLNRAILHLLSAIFLASASGCSFLGVAANAVPQYVKAKYPGLQNQSVGVMVWADRGVLIDWESIQLDLANAVQNKLQETKAEEMKGVTYPWKPASIVRYQRDHPGIEALPVEDVAPRLPNITRLIYIEVQGFRTRSETAMELFRGHGVISMRVIEVDQVTGKGKVAFTEENIKPFSRRTRRRTGRPTATTRGSTSARCRGWPTKWSIA